AVFHFVLDRQFVPHTKRKGSRSCPFWPGRDSLRVVLKEPLPGLDHADLGLGVSAPAAAASDRPLDALGRFLSRDDLRSGPAGTLLHSVDAGHGSALRQDPELDSAVEGRVAGFVRASIAEVADGDTS